MRLRSLLSQFDPAIDLAGVPDVEITGLHDDSRRIVRGNLFIARPGTHADGAQFISDAQQRGASAILTQTLNPSVSLPQVVIPDIASRASRLANIFHGEPSAEIKVIGITGTNGKTTTAYLVRHILGHVQKRCGMIGTVEIDDGANRHEAQLTTPGAVDVAELLGTMRRNRCAACAMETSSHALAQNRVSGVRFAGAGFTNLTGDHLDYHKTMDAYAAAKATLFTSLSPDAVAVVNIDDPHYEKLIARCGCRIVTFGIRNRADYHAASFSVTAQGSRYQLNAPDGSTEIALQLVGRHNIENSLCAIAICCELFGLSVSQVAAALRTAPGAPGRLQPVQAGQAFAVLVDYAHTDDALRNVLSALRPLTRGTLRLVFGCGGDRDRTKRPRMAKVAEQLADCVYVTSDNPRTEDPHGIIQEIMSGFSIENTKSIVIEPDRRRAIEHAIGESEPGDVVLLAGKGHENYQIVGAIKHHFDDVEEATRAITAAARA
ncbi:MAG: UDP-N-acetylmuramoyl-L-alanyl-D-glutamate--2,6-diaminopimelate ligase [Burkholderiales bacterium]|nr:UDP-N-acetylmuramoyl-L-alanyl-D-glutamate--2,6-diaminopimelate ligase [Phycisphaerae bacterium]